MTSREDDAIKLTSKNDQRDVNAQVYPEPGWTRRVFSTAGVIRAVALYRVLVDEATRHSFPVIHVAFLNYKNQFNQSRNARLSTVICFQKNTCSIHPAAQFHILLWLGSHMMFWQFCIHVHASRFGFMVTQNPTHKKCKHTSSRTQSFNVCVHVSTSTVLALLLIQLIAVPLAIVHENKFM